MLSTSETIMTVNKTSFLIKCSYWICPICIFLFFFMFQSICLHITTKEYIEYIEILKKNNKLNSGGQLFDVIGNYLNTKKINVIVPLFILDFIGCFPMVLFMCLTMSAIYFKYECIDVYNKTFIIGSMMAFFKGILDIVTIIPDSNGWYECKHRLNDKSFEFIKNLNFNNNFIQRTLDFIYVEIFGIEHKHIRYCADMILSGHTYFVILFSLANYKMITILFRNVKCYLKIMIKIFVLIMIFIEIILIELQRFHYTVDILLAVIMVLICWNNIIIDTIASDWASGYEWRNKLWVKPNVIFDIIFDKKRNVAYYSMASHCRNLYNYHYMIYNDISIDDYTIV
jgi:hypothetical protein